MLILKAMKKLIVILMAALSPIFLIAQDTPLSSLYDRYANQTGFETTEILPGAMSFEPGTAAGYAQLGEMMKEIEKIRFVKSDSGSGHEMEKFWKKILKAAGDDGYTEVVTVNSDDKQIRMVMMKSVSGNTREIGIIAKSDKGVVLLTVTGDMDFSKMFSPENMKGLREMAEHFMNEKGGCPHDE